MQTVNIHEAKTHLSRFVDQAAGNEIVIARAGKSVARLVALATDAQKPYQLWLAEQRPAPKVARTGVAGCVNPADPVRK